MTQTVYWLIQAQDQLQDALSDAGLDSSEVTSVTEDLNAKLCGTFPAASAIIVLERLGGFSNSVDKHILRVEVHGKHTLARVIKIAQPDELAKEWNGWRSCERPANDRGRAFMTLVPGKPHPADGCETLIYEDAHHTLHAATVVTLEEAVLGCCRWGVPTHTSILAVLDQVFAELVDRLYARSRSVMPTAERLAYLQSRLKKGLEEWKKRESVPGGCRNFARSVLPQDATPFLDVVDFYQRVLRTVNYLPEMRIGPAHGDLHSRNILVGLVDGEARWPAVFDYEEMSQNNMVAWDFVKLETELKIRALQILYPGSGDEFVKQVYAFERTLNLETEARNNQYFSRWHDRLEGDSPEDRLLSLMLGIRRQAKKCMDVLTRRGRRWLHEYYFFLAAYGVYAGRFCSYDPRTCEAAYVCASAAATRYLWAVNRVRYTRQDAEAHAERAIQTCDHTAQLDHDLIGHEAHLAFASKFARSRNSDFVKQAVALLQRLRDRSPSVPEIVQELAFANLELFDLSGDEQHERAAHDLLKDFDVLQQGLYSTDVELLCRWGRLWKERGDRALDTQMAAGAAVGAAGTRPKRTHKEWYEYALTFYRRAYEISGEYYPGINMATLLLLSGRSDESKSVADKILETIGKEPPSGQTESFWIPATRGEAFLLTGDMAPAITAYKQALQGCDTHARDSMSKQIKRIERALGDDFSPLLALF